MDFSYMSDWCEFGRGLILLTQLYKELSYDRSEV